MKVHRTHISHPEVPKLVYLMANLAYHLQKYHTWNQYLRARLDTCAHVNLMPMAVYCLMFKDPQLKKLTPSNMEIETYTSEIVKIIGMCHFYLVHPKSKHLLKVTIFIAKENGSVLLSCRTTMELGLIKPRVHLDYLPPKARLLTSTCDQPSKTRPYKPVIHYTKEAVIPNMSVAPSNITQNDRSISYETRKHHGTISRCFPRCRQIPRWTIQNPTWSPGFSQANTMQACSGTPKTSFQSRNQQDVRSRCSKTSPGGYTMDQ